MVVGGPELPTPLPRVSARGEATNISWPSTKNKRFLERKSRSAQIYIDIIRLNIAKIRVQRSV